MFRQNIFDYLKKYGERNFEELELTEVDILILARISYVNFERFWNGDVSIKQAAAMMIEAGIAKKDMFWQDDFKLFNKLAESKRYQDLKLSRFVYDVDELSQKQFAAIVIDLPNKLRVISYRGTDDNLVGWKEDFNLTFAKTIPAQIEARKYLRDVFWSNPFKRLILIGHSKGGNLAIYAASQSNFMTKSRIEQVYNIDGPGFRQEFIDSRRYQQIAPKITTLLPQSSIVGRMLNCGDHKVVKSGGFSLFQHDIYQWSIKDTKLDYAAKTDNHSDRTDKILTDWLDSLTENEREQFVDIVYQLISATKAKTISDLLIDIPKNVKAIAEAYKESDPKKKQLLNQADEKLTAIIKKIYFTQQ